MTEVRDETNLQGPSPALSISEMHDLLSDAPVSEVFTALPALSISELPDFLSDGPVSDVLCSTSGAVHQ